jgi:hypothetical protein
MGNHDHLERLVRNGIKHMRKHRNPLTREMTPSDLRFLVALIRVYQCRVPKSLTEAWRSIGQTGGEAS